MKESLETFVKDSNNLSAFQVFESLLVPQKTPLRVFVEGPKNSGKSFLVRGLINDAEKAGRSEAIFACSGADISIALQFEADESFFERLGSTPVLAIDDLEPLIKTEDGDRLLTLLISERDRQRYSTVITSDLPFDAYSFGEVEGLLKSFKVIKIKELGLEKKKEYVSLAISEYQTPESPEISDDAIDRIIEMFGSSFFDLENSVRYLLTDSKYSKYKDIKSSQVKELLEV